MALLSLEMIAEIRGVAEAYVSAEQGRLGMNKDLEGWISANFAGHGVAVRRTDEAPIPGEPFMSIETAKDIVRRFASRAAAPLTPQAPAGGEAKLREALREELIEALVKGTRLDISYDDAEEAVDMACAALSTVSARDGEDAK